MSTHGGKRAGAGRKAKAEEQKLIENLTPMNATALESLKKGLEKQDFIKSKYYECVKDKVPSVVIHAAKTRLGWNETNRLDVTSGDKAINMPVITFVETETE